ncbi:prepilin peptidase [Steroidobacter sp. S1-65]|uniref:Prepilin peptidase n=1 Tax=Steroidobacter gossypii TaxID=2805490 RepID=A0ABS1WYM6_9GAMM|nr:A24 family peptidase [Steroidobacter gossypii]MBM0106083.1 prepilin peptidase [Steroidobacter gossypii]
MLAPFDQMHAALITFVLAVAIIDWRTHRIPNLLCATAAIFGLSSQLWLHGEDGLLTALGGAAVGFAMFLPFYVLRAFGAGDVKAMATVGIFLGLEHTLLAVGMTLMAGTVLGLCVLLFKPTHARATMHRLFGLLLAPVVSMRNSRRTRDATSLRFPYGVAIACGTAVALLITTR